MLLTIEITAGEEAQLIAAARKEGLELPALARKLITAQCQADAEGLPPPPSDAKRQAAMSMLRSWIAQDASNDPEEIRRAEEDLAEFKRSMNANRAATGERLVFR